MMFIGGLLNRSECSVVFRFPTTVRRWNLLSEEGKRIQSTVVRRLPTRLSLSFPSPAN